MTSATTGNAVSAYICGVRSHYAVARLNSLESALRLLVLLRPSHYTWLLPGKELVQELTVNWPPCQPHPPPLPPGPPISTTHASPKNITFTRFFACPQTCNLIKLF